MKLRFMIILVLLIFTVGMVMGAASASHTFKDSGYKYKMSDKKYNAMKKHAKKYGKSLKKVTVSKTKYWTSIEKWKVGKTYKLYGGPKLKVVKLVKTIKGTKYGGGGYKYKCKQLARMECWVEYMGSKYIDYGIVV